MPTTSTESADPTTGRVTRSLRKRLTSIDSDVSSRPGTPVITNLPAIPETETPSKRNTRRVSLSTPAATPSKGRNRLENVEAYNSPMRRSTRRRSVSILEQEELAVQTKSKEPSVDVVKEEEFADKTPKVNNKRLTRSSSKSPTESLSIPFKSDHAKGGKKKLLSKSTEQEEEVIHLSDCSDTTTVTSPASQSKKTKVMLKKEKNIDVMMTEQGSPRIQSEVSKVNDKVEPTPSKVATQQKAPQKIQSTQHKSSPIPVKAQATQVVSTSIRKSVSGAKSSLEYLPGEPDAPKQDVVKQSRSSAANKNIEPSSPAKTQAEESRSSESKRTQKQKRISGVESPVDNSIERETSTQDGGRKRGATIKMIELPSPPKTLAKQSSPRNSPQTRKNIVDLSLTKTTNKLETSLKHSPQENRVSSTNNIIDQISPQTSVNLEESTNTSVELSDPAKTQLKQDSPQKKTRPEKLKNVCFDETAEDDAIKSIFPKTPGLTKSKSYILNNSIDTGKGTDEIQEQSIKETEKSSKDDPGSEEVLNAKTPYKMSLKALQCSTPIQNASPNKKNKTSEGETKAETSAKETEETNAVLEFPKSWSHSVSGTVDHTVKIDSVQSEEATRKQLEEEEAAKKIQNQSKEKHFVHDSDDDDDEDMLEEDDVYNDEDLDEEEDEEEDAGKTIFVDDEAMEVPEGEESMDSEERAYLEENEIPVHGESIGSEDTEEDEDEEEPDEEDEAFIVSDTEEVMHAVDLESDSNDEIETKSKKRKYKRIMKNSDSSNDGERPDEEENKDLCLILESSNDEVHGENIQDKLESSDDETAGVQVCKGRKSHKNKFDVEIEEEASNADAISMTDTTSKRKSTKKLKRDETEPIKSEEIEKVNKKTKRNTLSEGKEDAEKNKDSETEDKEKRKSLRSSESEKTSPKDDSEVEMEEREDKKTRKSRRASKLNKSVPSEVEIEAEVTESMSPRKMEHEELASSFSRKSLNRSKLGKNESENTDHDVSEDNQGDVNATTSQKRKSTNKNINENQEENPASTYDSRKSFNEADANKSAEPAEEVLNTSKKLSKKSLNKSNAAPDQCEDAEIPNEDKNMSLKQERKSLNRSNSKRNDSTTDIEVPNEKNNVSLREMRRSLNRSRQTDVTADNSKEDAVATDEEDDEIPNEDKNISSKKVRKSLNRSKEARVSVFNSMENESATDDDDVEIPKKEKNVSLKQERRSLCSFKSNESATEGEDQVGHNKKTLNESKRESLNNSKNNTRKSFVRTSTEEEALPEQQNRSLNKSKSEKSLEDAFDAEETLTASEIPSETSDGRSLNSSRRSRKSLNHSKLSQENDDDANISKDRLSQSGRKSLSQNAKLSIDSSSEEKNDHGDVEGESSSDEGEEARFSDAEVDDHENLIVEKSAINEFFGEEECHSPPLGHNSSRRKSANKTKLNETFEYESRSNTTQMNESLSRSLMRKSLNKSQLQREKNRNEILLLKANEADDLNDSPVEEEEVVTKVLPERGLSVSLSNIERKKNMKGDKESIRNSFTIGVSVRNTPRPPSSDSDKSENDDLSEEDLEKIKNFHRVGPYKPRHSLSTSLKIAPPNPEDIKQQKRIKRTSLYLQEQAASESFVENIAEEKKKVETKKKSKLNSFSENIAASAENEIQPKQSSEKASASSEDRMNIQNILSRCNDILEAANLAKREEKLKAKKNKVKKPKWVDKEEKPSDAEDEVKIPLVSRKQLKRKEKIKKELAKAIKHQAAMLKKIDPKPEKKAKISQIIETEHADKIQSSSKRFPTELLESLEIVPPQPRKKEPRPFETTPPSDKENSKKNSYKNTHTISEMPCEKKKKKHNKEILETKTGTVIVEPSTPEKLRNQYGFRESPKTPIGFKIEDIHSAGRNEREKARKRGRNIFTASGAFIEEDLTTSSKKEKSGKRKRCIDEPLYSLPKTQWTTSGVFVEEDLYSARPLANSTATQFMVTSLNGGKKLKSSSKVVSASTLSSASNFKQSALFSDKVKRETSRELIHRKQRKLANTQY